MKGLVKICSIMLISILSLFIGGCSNDTEVIDPNPEKVALTPEEVIKEVRPVIQGFLDAQYRYVIGEDKVPQWDRYFVNIEKKLDSRYVSGQFLEENLVPMMGYNKVYYSSEQLKNRIDEGIKNLSDAKIPLYIDYTSKIRTDLVRIYSGDNNIWYIENVIDRYSLSKSGDVQKGPRGGYGYSFSIQEIDGAWKITSWKEVAPIQEEKGRWYVPKIKLSGAKLKGNNKSRISKRLGSHSYNRYVAKNYALEHCDDPNPKSNRIYSYSPAVLDFFQ